MNQNYERLSLLDPGATNFETTTDGTTDCSVCPGSFPRTGESGDQTLPSAPKSTLSFLFRPILRKESQLEITQVKG